MAIILSRRMQALAEMVTPGSLLADVGCDHGFVSIYLVQHGICPRVCAMDINPGPLQKAREHVAACGLEQYIDVRLSDGVSALQPGEADCLLCAGMGGRLMQRILAQGREKVTVMRELILQPQSEIAEFRRFLREEGYVTQQERMILEDGKYYPMMRVVPAPELREQEALTLKMQAASDGRQERAVLDGQQERAVLDGQQERAVLDGQQRLADKFGGLLLKQGDPVLRLYLQERLIKYERILKNISSHTGAQENTEARAERKRSVLEEMEDVKIALKSIQ